MLRTIGILGIALLLQACVGGSSSVKEAANVTSSPTGADVYANGTKIGTTPLHKNLYEVFPAGWENWVYQAQGTLMVKKEGCEDFSHKVGDRYLSKPIHVKLKCNGVVKPKPVMHQTKPAMQSQPAATAAPARGVERRLQELDRLYKKGIINQQEYQATRKRILGEL